MLATYGAILDILIDNSINTLSEKIAHFTIFHSDFWKNVYKQNYRAKYPEVAYFCFMHS